MGQPGGQESKTNSNISWIFCILNIYIVNIVKSLPIHKIPQIIGSLKLCFAIKQIAFIATQISTNPTMRQSFILCLGEEGSIE